MEYYYSPDDVGLGNPTNPRAGCNFNGMTLPCSVVAKMASNGAAQIASDMPQGTLPLGFGGVLQQARITEEEPGGYYAQVTSPNLEFFQTLQAQNSSSTQKPNPNCIMNAVVNRKGRPAARGLARPFGNVNTNPKSPGYGIIGHDGVHVVADPGSLVKTLPVLTGEVLGIHNGGNGDMIVDVLLDNGNVALYKDLGKVFVKAHQRLRAGTIIGTVGRSSEGVGDVSGLHFAILKGGVRKISTTGKLQASKPRTLSLLTCSLIRSVRIAL